MRLSLVHWLIAAAVLANIAVYYWQHSQSPAVVRTDTTSGLRELKLLSEVESEPAAAVAPVSVPVDTTPPATPEQLPAAPPAGEEAVVASALAGEESETRALAPAATEEMPEVPPELPQRCWLAGPVDRDALSEQLTVAFAAAGVSMDLVLQTTEVSPDNWVHLPTSGEQADVRRLSQELRQAGFDNFPINDGPLAGSLSMGLFRSEERAIAVRDTLRARGYPADIYERPAFAEQPWITLDESGRIALDWPAVEGELPGYDALRLLAVECPP